MEKREGQLKVANIAELEKEVTLLTKALGDDEKTQKQLNDLKHTYTNCKKKLEHSNIKAAALRKEVVELKRVSLNGAGSDDVATLQLQH